MQQTSGEGLAFVVEEPAVAGIHTFLAGKFPKLAGKMLKSAGTPPILAGKSKFRLVPLHFGRST